MGAVAATNTSVSVGATTTEVLTENTSRRTAIFVNDSNETIYLSRSDTAVMNKGIRLNANGGYYEITKTNMYHGAVSAICASGSKNLTVSHS